ncbi:MAG TPA: DUF465 domain-containing protein [Thermoanaerobaculia bacterium]|nr:DUF465 domain-containing protein [Thermoanaerobaculia bacterium]
MPDRSDDVRQALTREDAQFRDWSVQHHRYEERLAELAAKPMLSPEEEFEEKELKKRKLILKDQMAAKMRNYALQSA